MNKKTVLYLFVICLAGFILVISRVNNETYPLSSYNYLPKIDSVHLVKHKYYSLSYSEEHEQPGWVAYTIIPSRLDNRFERPNYFRIDTAVIGGSANEKDYYKSGYDRGHMVPAADMQFDSMALRETFFYSNISPQLPGYNRGIWKSLESVVRDRAYEFDSLIVFTGPVFSESATTIGDNLVSVPVSFYKVLVEFKSNRIYTLSWLIPHKNGMSDISQFRVSIDSIESATGIDFLYYLPDKLEDRLERNIY